ncbi:hypothetical protein CEP14_14010 [Cylindrospermopsis raciborskii C04]|uniref:O-antigen polymerase n=1 Tax=Cylindrospermopsis raciborskii C07 TaxID=2014886 RepID=A0ABX4WL28_9CYAN|nr:hypothetical protein [Cylindrospermopsis raciborskii]PNJ93104.1 hypothetical protein CEP14_14010 [Cylindrospermopsis raciborskii C04]PNJ94256.1 hypothetical protein CEP15_13435 [Cylindrospermopsis raciborskii C07]PNJ94393.1 hypothetical protein CEP13_11005 [Cylindrospermopsis raciborskii C03]
MDNIKNSLNPKHYDKNTLLDNLLSGLFCIQILSGWISYVNWANRVVTIANLVWVVTGLLLLMIETLSFKKQYKFTYQLVGILLLGFLLNSLVSSNTSIANLAILLSNVGIALFLFQRKLASFVLPFTYLVFVFVCGYFIYFIIYRGIDPNKIFLLSSRNTVSMLLIYYSAILYIITDKVGFGKPILPAAVTLILSVISYGRSGIISSFFLITGILLLNSSEKRKSTEFNIFIFFCGIVFLTFIVANRADIVKVINNITHYFQYLELKGLADRDGRELIWRRYISAIDWVRFIFGSDRKYASSLVGFGGNYHNSFLELHANFGISGIIYMCLLLNAMLKLFNLNRLLLLILVTIVIRLSTDNGLFQSQYSFTVFYITLYAFKARELQRFSCK